MKTAMIILLLAITQQGWCQQRLTFPVCKEYGYNWAPVEKKMPRAQIDQFINAVPKEFELFRNNNSEFHNLDSLAKSLHFVDVNGDGKEDVFFDGASGGEATLIALYVRTGQGYKKVFSDVQGVAKIDWADHKIKRLYITDWGCCADYQETNKIYEFTYDQQGIPTHKQVYQAVTCYTGVGKRPDSLFDSPIRFEVLNDKYKIRFAAVINDTDPYPWSFDEKPPRYGNTIGLLKKGATGTALGKKTDATGREWWYVEMDEEYRPEKNIFYIDNAFPTRVIGWVSSRFVKVL
jgi:hypothetical protein